MSLKIVFMGTPEFAVASLKQLVDSGYNIVAVVTAPDKPAGRGQKISTSAVKDYALSQNIKVVQPVSLKDESFVSELRSLNADLFVVVAFRMLPEIIWQMPPKGTINLHASLLPQYRGAAPINWAIINGETKTGVSTFFIEKEIDTGKIIFREEVDISPETNAGELHDNLMVIGSKLIVKTVEAIDKNKISVIDQRLESNTVLKPAPKIFRDTCKINYKKTAQEVYNLVRGLSPYPGAWAQLCIDDKAVDVKIFSVSLSSEKNEIGSFVSDYQTNLTFFCSEGAISIEELQFPGKKRMGIQEFLRGNKFKKITFCN